MKKERIQSVDLIKIIACALVVGVHTLRPGRGSACWIIFHLCSIAIPLFFLCNGYTMFLKKEISYQYIMKKICKILMICFVWELLYTAAWYVRYRELRNFLASYLLDFLHKGVFFHFWFFGALILIYLVLPLIRRFAADHLTSYIRLVLCLGIILVLLDISMLVMNNQYLMVVPTSLRIWNWLFFSMMGGLLQIKQADISSRLKAIRTPFKIITVFISLLIMLMWMMIIKEYIGLDVSGSSAYSCLFVIGAAVAVFMVLSSATVQSKWIGIISGWTLGVYIIHPFVLSVFAEYHPSFVSGGSLENILFWILTLLSSALIVFVMKRIPLIRVLVEL